jgi:eukaryotic-like serine/threonine-protein kinase
MMVRRNRSTCELLDACLGEDTIQAFAEGRLSADAVADLEAHTRRCQVCSQLLTAALRAIYVADGRPAGAVSRGVSIGRYLVLDHLASGGMGDVFAAYDPELDRKIALKLLRAQGEARGARGRRRLLQEAKAVARLSHPNVVVVYDAGTHDDRVFVAMEFVEGQTLSAWLAARPRRTKEILTVFAAAARGLGAAHAAGLVHRDFKPQNVMVGGGGKVRVMDFGLARPIATEGASAAAAPTDAQASSLHGDAPLTLTGELLGTPLFMAPEQFQGLRTDARTDQFSFCVALYQALYQAHPFGADTLADLMARVVSGTVQPASPKSAVPAWLRRALLRGLSVRPSDRWPSMDALVGVIERNPAEVRRRRVVGGVALAVALIAGAGVWRAGGRGPAPCQGGAQRLAGVWEASGTGPSHDRVRTAFASTGLGYAVETWNRTAAVLDGYAAGWLGTYQNACEATHVRREQSAEVLDLRMACLDERLAGMRALVDVLAVADRDTVSRAVDAASALPPLDRCANVKLLREPVEPPRDAETRARVEAIRKRGAVVDALHLVGKHAQALELGRTLVAEARVVGYPPLLAERLQRLWAFEAGFAFAKEMVKDLEEAVWLALASRRDDVAAHAGALLAGLVGFIQARHEDGERWAAFSNALLDRLGPGHDRVRSMVLQARCAILAQAGDLDGTMDCARRALALKQRVLPPGSPDIAESLNAVAEAHFKRGDIAEALAVNARAHAIFVRAYGESSPWLGKVLSNRGEYLLDAGRPPEAIVHFKDALSRWEPQLGPEHPFLAYPLTGMGVAHWKSGRAGDALPPLERALRIRQAHEADPGVVADTRFALARALWDAGGDRARARRLAQAARDVYERVTSNPRPALEARAWLAQHGLQKPTPPL